MGADVYLSVGDPRPNLGATRAIAAALGLADEHDAVYRHATAAEASQAGGRMRAPWRTTPALHVHVGTVAPYGWDASAEVLELPRGPTHCLDPTEAAESVRVYGSQRLAAAAHGTGDSLSRVIARGASDSEPLPAVQVTLSIYSDVTCTAGNGSKPLEPVPPVPKDAARALIAAAGGVTAAAQRLGVGKGTVSHWRSGARAMPREAADVLGAPAPVVSSAAPSTSKPREGSEVA